MIGRIVICPTFVLPSIRLPEQFAGATEPFVHLRLILSEFLLSERFIEERGQIWSTLPWRWRRGSWIRALVGSNKHTLEFPGRITAYALETAEGIEIKSTWSLWCPRGQKARMKTFLSEEANRWAEYGFQMIQKHPTLLWERAHRVSSLRHEAAMMEADITIDLLKMAREAQEKGNPETAYMLAKGSRQSQKERKSRNKL